jgi:hypothetical protein
MLIRTSHPKPNVLSMHALNISELSQVVCITASFEQPFDHYPPHLSYNSYLGFHTKKCKKANLPPTRIELVIFALRHRAILRDCQWYTSATRYHCAID